MAGELYIGFIDAEWICDQIRRGRFVRTTDLRRIAMTDAVEGEEPEG